MRPEWRDKLKDTIFEKSRSLPLSPNHGYQNQFFSVIYKIYNNPDSFYHSRCHDYIVQKFTGEFFEGIMRNYYDEEPEFRIEKFHEIFKEASYFITVPPPEFLILDKQYIYFSFKGDIPRKQIMFYLKLMRFSYLWAGEPIGQLILNNRYLRTPKDDVFISNSNSEIIQTSPSNWFYSLSEKEESSSFLSYPIEQKIKERAQTPNSCLWNLAKRKL